MAIELKMPALSPTMEEGTLAKWLVKEGDIVKSGDILAEIETDKATMEFEAVDEGTIGQILVPEGTDNVKVGTVIATIQGEGEEQNVAPAQAGAASNSEPTPPRGRRMSLHPLPLPLRTGPPRPNALPTPRSPKAPRWSSSPSAKRCATRWPRKCEGTTASL